MLVVIYLVKVNSVTLLTFHALSKNLCHPFLEVLKHFQSECQMPGEEVLDKAALNMK